MKIVRFCKKCFDIFEGPSFPEKCHCGGEVKETNLAQPVSIPVLDGQSICDKCGTHNGVGSWESGLMMGVTVVWRGNHKLCSECNDSLIAVLSSFFGS